MMETAVNLSVAISLSALGRKIASALASVPAAKYCQQKSFVLETAVELLVCQIRTF
jgi:hypothetical protein